MRNTGKKIFSIVAATTLAAATLVACSGKQSYKGDALTAGYDPAAAVSSQGGFVVEKGDYAYFINGAEEYTAGNKYGDVAKGALMRIKTDMSGEAEVVVPSLFAAQNFDVGIYIYGDYVYYATPTTDKNLKGQVENSYIDFKRAKIDGSEAPMKGYFFRLATNTANFRFVTVPGVDRNADGEEDVFCLYEEDSALKSYNTATGENAVLVKGAKSSFFFDKKDLANPTVYYTMAVPYDDEGNTKSYDQLYSVNAAARVESVNASTATYKVENGREYTFDAKHLKEHDHSEDLNDYTTYPYVNLGTLVLDGVGSGSGEDTQYNNASEKDSARDEVQGYNYTIARYQNGGVYFTRKTVVTNSSAQSNTSLYYLTDNRGAEWNTVTGNKQLDVVATDTTNASDTALYEVTEKADGTRVHSYLYLSNNTLYLEPDANGANEPEALAYNVTGATLWKTQGDYLYYYGTGTNGNSLSRINYKGNFNADGEYIDQKVKSGDSEEYILNPLYPDEYNPLLIKDEYKPVLISYVDWNSSWYKPEFVGDTLLYSNAQSYGAGSTAYNYIYATKLGSYDEVKAQNEAYEAVTDYIDDYSDSTSSQALIKYYFRTDGAMSEETAKLYDKDLLEEVQAKFATEGEDILKKESSFISLVGKMKADDKDAIADEWANSLLQVEEEETKDKGMPTWAIVLIVVGAIIVVAAAVAVPLIVVYNKKKAKKKEEEATVNAYKRKKIDTTDDKTIDVYADEKAETAEETTEEASEEATEAVAEETPATEASEEENN